MVNKIGLLNGIFLFLLNIFAEIPLGIYISSGFNNYAGLSLSLIKSGDISVYAWGIIDLGSPYWWMDLGNGILNFILIQIFLIVCCILTILASYSNSKAGKIEFLISIILIVGTIIYILIDVFVLGMFLITPAIPVNQIFGSIGIGFYLLLFILILEILARYILKKKLIE